MSNLLIIDDEDKLRSLLKRILELEGYQVFTVSNGQAALSLLQKESVDVVLSDVKLPDINGLDLLEQIKTKFPSIEVVMLTAYGTIDDGVKAIKKGAFDYITKGDDNERIIPLIKKATEKSLLQQQVQKLENRIYHKFNFESILGNSAALKTSINLAKKVAPTSTTVMLLGETGTGKEVFAQAIHSASNRRAKSFVAINCSGFSREIMESELFGYRAGAFTGAVKNTKGLFEEADQGTMFLDEIGEIPLEVQAKLLRVLENGTFLKLGDTQEKKVNVRLITATNRDLKKEVKEGRFREDLYFRISTFTIELPSLRDRKEDIVQLANFFALEFGKKLGIPIKHLAQDFLDRIIKHSWKGNIRELKNIMERSVILSEEGIITAKFLPDDIRNSFLPTTSSQIDLASIESSHITDILRLTSGNKAEAARILKIGISTLYRKIEEYQINL